MRERQHPFHAEAPLATDSTAIGEYALTYFKDILTSRRQPDISLQQLQGEQDLRQHTHTRLGQEAADALEQPFTAEELQQVVKCMARGKRSGSDGLPVEFYEATWEHIGADLLKLYNRVSDGDILTEEMKLDIITLIYKKDDKSNIRNWRPISRLNVSYKILAKALSRRLAPHLPRLVHKDQGAFIQGRSIAENILMAVRALEVIPREKRQVIAAMLDLEKAYDLMEILLNAFWASPRIQGLALGESDTLLTEPIADDLLLVMEVTQESMGEAKTLLDTYCTVSEAQVNWNKSVYFLPKEYNLTGQDWGMKRIPPDISKRYLGVQVSLSNAKPRQQAILQAKVQVSLKRCRIAACTSLLGRALLINAVVFAQVWFIADVRLLSKEVLKPLTAEAARYLWKPTSQEGQGYITKCS
ncbi:hypothetical protein CBR_g26199 [Chara braunii]|uniref:Reverse transcriptase domain-containing protein n=1 Tax=Chara braunii TaxID=69332 RepID=A0A388L791_CHABU|nr:hypothetical protein CBR_g26199 [Chara braunii]|eukprot:GBG78166.1 hypothetical protein CBR_g26199 [Chara braunii]